MEVNQKHLIKQAEQALKASAQQEMAYPRSRAELVKVHQALTATASMDQQELVHRATQVRLLSESVQMQRRTAQNRRRQLAMSNRLLETQRLINQILKARILKPRPALPKRMLSKTQISRTQETRIRQGEIPRPPPTILNPRAM